jgi:DNA polymerase-3 subunit beta
MKVTLPTQVLLDAVGHGAAVAASKSPKPVLECIALRADPTTGIALEATDLDVGIRIHLEEADVLEAGSMIVPAARLLSVVREVDEESVTLAEEDGSLTITTGQSHFRIRGEEADSFVDLPFFPDEGGASLPGGMLRRMIRRTVFATAKEAGRYALHGVLFHMDGASLELVATDGRRLARAAQGLGEVPGRDMRVIVGPKGLSLLDRVMGSEPDEVSVALEERQVLFRVGGTLVISRLIDGTFPAYEDVIPPVSETGFQVTVADLASALRRASILTTRDAQSVQFDIGAEQLTIRSRAPEIGEARVDVTIAYDGPPQQLGFNPGFISEALKVMDSDAEVRFEFTDGKSPGRLSDSEDYVYVVMPIALE